MSSTVALNFRSPQNALELTIPNPSSSIHLRTVEVLRIQMVRGGLGHAMGSVRWGLYALICSGNFRDWV